MKASEVAKEYNVHYRTLMGWIKRGVFLGPAFSKVDGNWVADPEKLKGLEAPQSGDLTVELKMRITPSQLARLKQAAGEMPTSTFIRKRFLETL